MTKRILLVGNCYIPPFKRVWEKIKKERTDFELGFFAIGDGTLKQLVLTDDLIFGAPPNAGKEILKKLDRFPGRQHHVNFKQFDAVVRVGLGFGDGLYRALVTGFDIDGVFENGNPRRISKEFFCDAARANFREKWFEKEWSNWGDDAPRLFVNPKNWFSEKIHDLPDGQEGNWAKLRDLPDTVQVARDLYHQCLADVLDEHGVEYILQPKETQTPQGLTKLEYSVGSKTRNPPNPTPQDLDYRHAGEAQAMLILEDLFARMEQG